MIFEYVFPGIGIEVLYGAKYSIDGLVKEENRVSYFSSMDYENNHYRINSSRKKQIRKSLTNRDLLHVISIGV